MREARWKATQVHSEAGQQPVRPGSAVMLAALPHLLMAIVTGLGALFPGGSSPFALLAYVAPAMMVIAFVLAWRRGWPIWSGSWAGYWLLLLFFLVSSLFPFSPGLEYLALVLLIAAAVILFQRRPVHGLLACLPLLLLIPRLFVFELLAGGDFVWSGVWLLLALTAGLVAWSATVRAGLLLVTSFQLIAGLAFAVATAYLPFRFSQMGVRQPAEFLGLINAFVPLTLALITIPLGLLLLRPTHQLALRGGKRGQAGWMFLLPGVLIALGGLLVLQAPSNLLSATPWAAGPVATIGLGMGMGLSLLGAMLQASAAWSSVGCQPWRLLLPLLAATAPLVVFALPAPFSLGGRYSDRFLLQLTLGYSGVLIWTALALLTLWRIYAAPAPARPSPSR